MSDKKEEYNDEPISYCSICLEISIAKLRDTKYDYCKKCGCTEIYEAHVYDWEEKYIELYGERYLKRTGKVEGK